MLEEKSQAARINLLLIALSGWFALIVQFYLNLNSGVATVKELLIRYFSYFTILTNLLVAVCATTLFIKPDSLWGKFFTRQNTLTAITVYIFVVGLVYNVVLRFLWNPHGLQMVVDELLHSVIPVLMVFYWLTYVFKNELHYQSILRWLIYPFVYAVFVIFRGNFSGFYPYPFIDVSQLGINKALLNVTILTGLFYLVSVVFVAIGKYLSRGK